MSHSLQQLKHYTAAARSRLTDGSTLDALCNPLRRYLSAAWRRSVDREQSRNESLRLLAAARFAVDCLSPLQLRWLIGSLPPPVGEALRLAAGPPHTAATTLLGESWDESSRIHCFEQLLGEIDPEMRKRAGVFYTPRPVVRYIVSQVHRLLRDEFTLADGLAELAAAPRGEPNRTNLQLLDPAVGTGVFLVEAIELIHATLAAKWRNEGKSEEAIGRLWSGYVTANLLTRLIGIELLPASCLLASVNLALKLADTGFDFAVPSRLRLYVADTLAGPWGDDQEARIGALPATWCLAARDAATACQDANSTVVIGNPPYSAFSNCNSRWIEQLIRGRLPGGESTVSYYEVDGSPLNERKLWLHDDYVKFLRFGQWKIEQAGGGILAMVTNHGYLDNPTFRGMRQQLLGAFSRISVIDLHGNTKKRETSGDGSRDESVFGVEQGAAIGLFRKIPSKCEPCRLDITDVWGGRADKYRWLATQSGDGPPERLATELQPAAPFYFFVARDDSLDDEYRRGISLTEVFPIYASAVVTARDSFAIAFERAELERRIDDFRDETIPDEAIRRRYFQNTRSRKYPPGDTRGWKLPAARRRLREDGRWRDRIRTCLYRPFDKRYIYWSDDLIDWPRNDVMRHLLDGENIALVARRQMPPTQPCRYFWIADDLVIDGVIRSDNRGNESVFPLYLRDDSPSANLNPDLLSRLSRRYQLGWVERGCGDLRSTFGPEAVMQYLYALFHAVQYRRRYANQLRVEFPRLFFPASRRLFRFLSEAGGQLIARHSTAGVAPQSATDTKTRWRRPPGQAVVDRGYPRWRDDRVETCGTTSIGPVSAPMWQHHVGGHQVLRKWLKDRRGRPLTQRELHAYAEMAAAVRDTIELTSRIERRVARAGSWPAAFTPAL